MGRISGKSGQVAISGTNIVQGTDVYLKQWSINYQTMAVDVTAFGDVARRKVPGIKEWRGTARGSMDGTSTVTMPTATATATFTVATQTWVGNLVITDINPDVSVDGEAGVSITFEGDGDLTLA